MPFFAVDWRAKGDDLDENAVADAPTDIPEDTSANMPPVEHVIFIPGVFLIGMVVGWIFGARAVRGDLERKKKRAQE
jgi:hypothetical protein